MQKEPRKVREFRRREQEILDTALKLFLEQGEDSVTVEMIADAVGIGKGTIYKHFKSKAEIYLRLMLDYERDLAALFHSEDVARDKEALSRAYFEFRMRDPQRYRLFDRLEEKVVKTSQVPEMVEELHKIRASNFDQGAYRRRQAGERSAVLPLLRCLGVGAWRRGAVPLAVLARGAGRPGRFLPLPDGYRRAHGQQAQARRRRSQRLIPVVPGRSHCAPRTLCRQGYTRRPSIRRRDVGCPFPANPPVAPRSFRSSPMSVREFPIHYIEPVFRPPSEAHSLVLPVTNGCSWNKCGFCEMYTQPQKKFRARDENEVLEEIRRCGERLIVKRVFLADGDALVLPTRRLLAVLQAIREHLPEVERVSSYCLPRNLRRKSVDELRELADAGLRMAYVGAESGDDEVLARVNKGETYSSTLDALEKLGEAGISRSVMILNGLGGMTLSAQHADNSARLMNAAQPEYLSTLVVSFPTGEQRFRAGFADFEALDRRALFVEVERLLQGLELEDTVFRSDHASNYLVLKGELGADKARLLAEVRQAIEQPQHAALRQEWQRGL